jgi:hypothetical protein
MKQSEYIQHLIRSDLQKGGSFEVVAESSASYNTTAILPESKSETKKHQVTK